MQRGLQFRQDLILPVIMAFAVTLLAFYVDEGKYNFDGVYQPDNLIFLIAYGALFFGFQQLVKAALEYFLGVGKSQRILAGALAALSLPLALIIFLWMVSPA